MAVCFTGICLQAEVRTWTGGGGDAKWSTPANWGGTAPVANDTLVFSGTARLASVNDFPEDTLFAGIIFSSGAGAFTLSGNRIALDGPVSNLSASAQTFSLGMALTGTRVFDASNGAITVNGALSGAGGLTKTGPQSLTLTASNSYDGVTTVDNGMLHITHGHALGSTNGHTLVNSKSSTVGGGYLQLSGNITVPEPLTLFGERNAPSSTLERSSLFNAGGTNTWSGSITRKSGGNNTRIHLKSGSRLNITGGVTGGGAALFVMRADNAILAFYEKPLNIGSDTLWVETKGTIIFGVAGNVWGGNPNLGSSYTVRMEAADALAPSTPMAVGNSATDGLTLDLNGLNQRIGKLYSKFCTSGDRIITTPAPATLTVDQGVNTNTHLDARLNGPLTLVKTGMGMLTLSNSVATTAKTTGDIIVSNGTLRVAAPGCLGNATNVTVAGGTLSLQSATTIKDTASLFITSSFGTQVEVGDGIAETVGKLFINGVQQANGSWGTTDSGATHKDDTLFAGKGKILVTDSPEITAATATWDAGGADTLASTADNWADDAVPALNGTTHAYFGTGGTAAVFNTAANLYGITFNATNDFTVDSGAGTLAIGAGGITAAIPDTLSRTYTLAGETLLSCDQTWTVTTNLTGTTALQVSAAIRNDDVPFGINKEGRGNLSLSGNNSYDGPTCLNAGTLTIAHNNALGSTNGPTLIADGAWIEMKGGITVDEPLSLPSDASLRWNGGLRATGGSNVWAGKITSSPANSRIQCNAGSLDIIGGIEGGQMCLGGSGGTYLRVSEKPINTPGNSFFAHTGILIILAVTNNAWTSLTISGNYVRMDMENVLPVTSTLMLGEGNMTVASGIDLNGHNQTIGQLTSYTNNTILNVFSETPATLTVNQTVSSTFNGNITGLVSLVKMGSGQLTLTRASSTFGSYIVSNGTLAVSATGALGENSTNIWVAGGTLSLSNSAAISDRATLSIANGGAAKVELAAGVNESVGYLYFGNKQQRAGTYSATSGSGVQVTDATHFSGTGILTVLHDSAGTVIGLR